MSKPLYHLEKFSGPSGREYWAIWIALPGVSQRHLVIEHLPRLQAELLVNSLNMYDPDGARWVQMTSEAKSSKIGASACVSQ